MLRVAPEDAPPSLVIVADEFATLVKEIPDFVAGIVDIAQRGRSLGIHLVLATQRPAGAVNDNILANTNLRISLRVLDRADSSSIIGVPDAAAIPVPLRGRALARTGPAAPVPFQSAWSGAPFRTGVQEATVTVRPFGFGGVATGPSTAGASAGVPDDDDKDDPETQLEVAIRVCADAAALRGAPPPRRPWVEPLAEAVHLDALWPQVAATVAADPGRYAVLGLADDPDSQCQYPVVVDLEATGGLVVFGTGGSGKTTLLRTVAAGLAYQGRADAVQIHALDFAGRSLAALEDLPQVAGVVMNDEVERTTRLLTVLRTEIEQRRRVLADARVESLSALRHQHGEPVLPRIVLLLDSYPGFHSTFDQGSLYHWITELQRLVTEGRQVGVHVVLTINRQLGMPTALLSAMSARVVLRMASVDELTALGVARSQAVGAELPDGRGFLDGRTEVQIAAVSADPTGVAQAAALAAVGERFRDAGVAPAAPLPELPERLPAGALVAAPERLQPVIGVVDLTLAPVRVDLTRTNLVITGPPLSGRSTAAAAVAAGLAGTPDAPVLVGLGAMGSPLADFDGLAIRGFGRAAVGPALDEATALVAGDDRTDVRVVLFVDAVEDLESAELAARLEQLVRHDAVRVVAVVDAATLSRTFSGWVAELKNNRSVLLLQPASVSDIESFTGRRVPLRPEQPFPPGRGVLVDRRAAVLVQVAVP
jgi:DNA segregation ATPase FtsK/SpoIIIE, S-DNA-T family